MQHAIRLLAILSACGEPVTASDPANAVKVVRSELRLQTFQGSTRPPARAILTKSGPEHDTPRRELDDVRSLAPPTACKHGPMGNYSTCAVCGVTPASTGQGEHVWPRWFLKAMDALGPPKNAWSVNGRPVTNRDGEQIHGTERQRVMLPACIACNSELNSRFEEPAKSAVGHLARNQWSGSYSNADWRAVGMWWAKVLLLLGHPQARIAHPYLDKIAVRFDGTPPDNSWMVKSSGPSSHLSLWVFNATMTCADSPFTLVLPSAVVAADGSRARCHVLSLATPGLCVTVVSHAGLRIDHPLVERGQAWELLHNPPSGDLSQLPQLAYDTITWVRGGAVQPAHVVGANQSSQLEALFSYEDDGA
jgi:hypothetical protein